MKGKIVNLAQKIALDHVGRQFWGGGMPILPSLPSSNLSPGGGKMLIALPLLTFSSFSNCPGAYNFLHRRIKNVLHGSAMMASPRFSSCPCLQRFAIAIEMQSVAAIYGTACIFHTPEPAHFCAVAPIARHMAFFYSELLDVVAWIAATSHVGP